MSKDGRARVDGDSPFRRVRRRRCRHPLLCASVEELARIDSSVCITIPAHHRWGRCRSTSGAARAEAEWLAAALHGGKRSPPSALPSPRRGPTRQRPHQGALDNGEGRVDGARVSFITNAGTEISGFSRSPRHRLADVRKGSRTYRADRNPRCTMSSRHTEMGWNSRTPCR